jgi:hypothetical protein
VTALAIGSQFQAWRLSRIDHGPVVGGSAGQSCPIRSSSRDNAIGMSLQEVLVRQRQDAGVATSGRTFSL